MGVILDILKFVFSSDFRDSVKSIFKIAKSSKDWKKDILVYKGGFNQENEYELQALVGQSTNILTEKGWENDNISSVSYIITELTRNGIEHSKSNDDSQVKIEICSNYVRIEITDKGQGFDLMKELINQDALNENSRKCKALGVIYRMSTTLVQENKKGKHKIIATVIKGYKSCKVYLREDITVFEFNSEVSYEGYFWAIFTNTLKSMKVDDKVIIYFNDLRRFASMCAETVNDIVYQDINKKEKFIFTQKEGNVKSSQVIICGNNNLNYVLRDYLNANFEYFDNIDEGINFLKTGKSQKQIKNIPITPPINWIDGLQEK